MPRATDPLNAFCRDDGVVLHGAESGPLAGLKFAAKDVFDVAGHVTGGGNPDWRRTHGPAPSTAWAVRVLVEAGAAMAGKTVTDELTRGILGDNVHYGMPTNPRAPGRVPGGSSSGSAAAVAGGLVDFALGTDTGGSVRAPASFCGLYGLRPTHGRISMDGVMPNAPSFDTVGFFARDAELLARVGAVLLQSEAPPRLARRLVIADDAFEASDPAVHDSLGPAVVAAASLIGNVTHGRLAPLPLEELPGPFAVLQGSEAWHSFREWIEATNPRMAFEVAARFALGREVDAPRRERAQRVRDAVTGHVAELTSEGSVVCLPTLPFPAPEPGLSLAVRRDLHRRIDMLVDSAGLAGTPQISVPAATVDGLPVGLSFVAARGSDELLTSFALELQPSLGSPG